MIITEEDCIDVFKIFGQEIVLGFIALAFDEKVTELIPLN